MPDGALSPVDVEAQDAPTLAADARLLERVWRNLTLWSGGTTLLVLLALSVVLYAAVAGSLANAGVGQLENRFNRETRQRPDPGDDSRLGFVFGDATYALALDADGDPILGPGRHLPDGFPYQPGVDAAAGGGRDIQTATIGETPVRVLTQQIVVDGETYTLQIVQDRTVEQQTLQIMLAILLFGGLVVIVVAFGFGTIYARRALVPIRESLAGQRSALRRQREFAADASHELRTPLTVIRSSVEHLDRHRAEPVESVGSALVDIDDEVRHMTAIVEDLLLLARSDSGAVQLERIPVDLSDVVMDGATSMAKPAADRGVSVGVDPVAAVITGDPARLRQLVVILVDNAIRHSPSGGHVSVRLGVAGSVAELVVEDQGPGISADAIPHLFERFYRAPGAPGGGTGLGLAIAAWIVDRHGGRISAENRAEGGARFKVSLPTGTSAPTPTPTAEIGPDGVLRPGS
jgi:signal transduction histidine kinase